MVPKVIFRYSKIYNGLLKMKLKGEKFQYPSRKVEEKILNYIKKIEKIWKKDEKRIFAEISKITKLPWKEKEIYCYLIEKGNFALSDPLTLPIYKKLDFFVDFLTHELIHRIFALPENFKKSKKAWDYIYRKYRNESEKTKIHIIIQSIHNHIYLKFYNKERLKRDILWATLKKDYKRAWDIIQKEGYQKIINEYRKRVKIN